MTLAVNLHIYQVALCSIVMSIHSNFVINVLVINLLWNLNCIPGAELTITSSLRRGRYEIHSVFHREKSVFVKLIEGNLSHKPHDKGRMSGRACTVGLA